MFLSFSWFANIWNYLRPFYSRSDDLAFGRRHFRFGQRPPTAFSAIRKGNGRLGRALLDQLRESRTRTSSRTRTIFKIRALQVGGPARTKSPSSLPERGSKLPLDRLNHGGFEEILENGGQFLPEFVRRRVTWIDDFPRGAVIALPSEMYEPSRERKKSLAHTNRIHLP